MTTTDVLSAAVVYARAAQPGAYRCGWCASGHHQRCPGVFTTAGGTKTVGCACAYTWRHAI